MTIPAWWNESWTAAPANHLWQSTVVVGVAWLLAMALRKNHARARYWVWFAASIKFLLPFSLLISAGEGLHSLIASPMVAKPALANAMEQIAQPFAQAQFFDAAPTAVAAHHANWLPLALLAVWAFGALIVAGRFARAWWTVYAAKREALRTSNRRSFASGRHCGRAQDDSSIYLSGIGDNFEIDVPVLSSPGPIEPGIFGIFRPVLLLPEGILQRLTPEQLSAIVAHEMCHVRRRDNLTFALHMVVEALFWFHPAVWWIGARLIEERERACDEAVLAAGSEAEVYAEGILNVCKLYVESPLACVAGVTGADLKQRIVRIMSCQVGLRVSPSRKILLAAIATLVIAVPIVLGQAKAAQEQVFEVASIRPLDPHVPPDNSGHEWVFPSNRFTMRVASLNTLIIVAYGTNKISGGPDWVKSQNYSVSAKVGGDALLTQKQMQPLLQNLLEERFHLKVHRVQNIVPGYALVVAKGGPRLQPTKGGPFFGMAPVCELKYQDDSVENFAKAIGHSSSLNKPVVDRTGLDGMYDFDLKYVPEDNPNTDNPSCSGLPDIFTAVQRQLGLKLVPQKVPVDSLVIDHVERPSPN